MFPLILIYHVFLILDSGASSTTTSGADSDSEDSGTTSGPDEVTDTETEESDSEEESESETESEEEVVTKKKVKSVKKTVQVDEVGVKITRVCFYVSVRSQQAQPNCIIFCSRMAQKKVHQMNPAVVKRIAVRLVQIVQRRSHHRKNHPKKIKRKSHGAQLPLRGPRKCYWIWMTVSLYLSTNYLVMWLL